MTEAARNQFTRVFAADGTVLLAQDETPREGTTADGLAQLPPAFARLGEKTGIDLQLAGEPRHGDRDRGERAGAGAAAMVDGR